MRCRLLPFVIVVTACGHSASNARVTERDQLRREIVGYRGIDPLVRNGVVADERRAFVSVSAELFRDLLIAALPVAVDLPGGTTVTVDRAEVIFRGNVARVDLGGEIRRRTFPRAQARVTLRGALDSLTVDSTQALRARLTIDDATVDEPGGVPGALSFLTPIVQQGLPQLTAALPAVAIPIQLDAMLQLPGFGPEGAVYVRAVHAPVTITASRVVAFQDRLWVFLMIERGAFTAADSSAATPP